MSALPFTVCSPETEAQGLAAFTPAHGDEFARIETIAEVGRTLKARDLLRDEVRDEIEAFSGTQATLAPGSSRPMRDLPSRLTTEALAPRMPALVRPSERLRDAL
jgi:hypothetical protein